eukprot:TRINITY_DN109004_c0_g1_i1.p1 TRINITY_DN109004_c0_g1~~TRINITY_DN109004_c0_g1_i1.p1  ORF type:complete len:338 (-),score=73.68 TRINITY_DN109004_c0_g1_i1:32-1045(-)
MSESNSELRENDVSATLVDSAGVPLCSHAIWGRRCRWGKKCSYSHDVPPDVLESYQEEARQQTLCAVALRASQAPKAEISANLRALHEDAAIFRYDTKAWQMLEALQDILEILPDENLEDLHKKVLSEKPPLCPALLQAYGAVRGVSALPLAWQDAWGKVPVHRKAMLRSEAYKRFLRLYDDFCLDVIVPLTGDAAAYVQRPPTIRVFLAGQAQAKGKIGMHKDGDYPNHFEAEVNFWVPLTPVGGNNSLFVESMEGQGDFKPLEMQYGELFRFHGYSCRHHTNANDTGKTRVSFDLRAVPKSCFEDFDGQKMKPPRLGDYDSKLYERSNAEIVQQN